MSCYVLCKVVNLTKFHFSTLSILFFSFSLYLSLSHSHTLSLSLSFSFSFLVIILFYPLFILFICLLYFHFGVDYASVWRLINSIDAKSSIHWIQSKKYGFQGQGMLGPGKATDIFPRNPNELLSLTLFVRSTHHTER